MLGIETLADALLMIFCYAYVLTTIYVSIQMPEWLHVSQRASRKFLHVMIGNLPFVIPFFTSTLLPALVAAPFILVTFLSSPASPFRSVNKKLQGLVGMTEEGHHWGLILYSISYTLLALFFASKPIIIAAGILPMAYGDSAAAVVGERLGRRKYKFLVVKSLEGSIAMLLATFLSLTVGFILFSVLNSSSISGHLFDALGVALATTLAEGISPKGFDNLTVPFAGALAFILLSGGTR